ncbi:hypothetical protein FOI67_09365 [Geobacillus sp. LEMMJ02]|nr:hypothetical protein FOI67_09365 [Geobacillus sp. LEMMJ02]
MSPFLFSCQFMSVNLLIYSCLFKPFNEIYIRCGKIYSSLDLRRFFKILFHNVRQVFLLFHLAKLHDSQLSPLA